LLETKKESKDWKKEQHETASRKTGDPHRNMGSPNQKKYKVSPTPVPSPLLPLLSYKALLPTTEIYMIRSLT
jgi:hypothetical protein